MSLICHGTTTCTAAEVGPFMQNISAACGNNGDCQLPDIMTVVANVGNYVLGLVGAVVLLMFVVGGFYMIASGGNMDRVKTGKRYITTSIVGLLIVFGAFAAIQTLKAVLTGSPTGTSIPGQVVDCTGQPDGNNCGFNMECQSGICMPSCEAADREHAGFSCYDTQDPSFAGHLSSCFAQACPGPAPVQCCIFK